MPLIKLARVGLCRLSIPQRDPPRPPSPPPAPPPTSARDNEGTNNRSCLGVSDFMANQMSSIAIVFVALLELGNKLSKKRDLTSETVSPMYS